MDGGVVHGEFGELGPVEELQLTADSAILTEFLKEIRFKLRRYSILKRLDSMNVTCYSQSLNHSMIKKAYTSRNEYPHQ